MTVALNIMLVVVVLIAAVTDLRSRRIPNLLTIPALIVALGMRAFVGGDFFLDGLAAAGITLALALPVFALGGVGGGDVKLLTAVGAFLGFERLWGALFVTLLVGAALAIVSVLRQGKAGETVANLYILAKGLARKESYTGWKGEEGDAPLTIRSAGVVTRPFAVAIAAGAIYAVYPVFY